MSEHTPGPWHVVPYGDGNALVICTEPDGNWRICFLATPGDSYGAWKTIKADAHLIAAAPEMFEALKRWVDLAETAIRKIGIEPHPDERTCLVIAKAALAKASPDTAVRKDGGEG
jgi:hypothetical protein